MNDILHQIKINKDLFSNPDKFIKNRKLKYYKIKQDALSVDLPQSIGLGTIYIIGSHSIIESYSWCNYEYSPYIQINHKEPRWLNCIYFHNLSPIDLGCEFYNEFYNIDEIYAPNPSDLDNFVCKLLKKGLKIYIY